MLLHRDCLEFRLAAVAAAPPPSQSLRDIVIVVVAVVPPAAVIDEPVRVRLEEPVAASFGRRSRRCRSVSDICLFHILFCLLHHPFDPFVAIKSLILSLTHSAEALDCRETSEPILDMAIGVNAMGGRGKHRADRSTIRVSQF